MRRGILATRDELSDLSKRILRRPYDTIYETLNRRCSLILETAPITETQWRSLWQRGVWGSALLAARTTQGRILDLLIAHHINPNIAYRNRAIEELKNLISWTTWVDPCHPHLPADLCTAEAGVAAVVGLDWLWEDMSAPDRLRVLKAIRTKAIEPYRQGVQQQVSWYNTYSNWNAVVNAGCGLAGLALSDDDGEALEACNWAKKGLKQFFAAMGREGGWDEGIGYWGFAMRYLLLFGEGLARLDDDQLIFRQRGMDATGLFPVYFTPNGQAANFGDNPAIPLYGTLYLLSRHFGIKELTWWLDTYSFHRDVSTSGWSAAGLAMLFRPVDAESPKIPDLLPLKVFHEIGWATMADSWPRPQMYVAAKAGDLSANHSQRDMNSIQVQIDGEMLLIDLGHPPYSRRYLSQERGEFYEVQAKAHNTVVVGERDHMIEAQGDILEAQSAKDYRWVALDSASACGEDVRFIRHIVMIVDPGKGIAETLVVLDEVTCGAPERVDLFWHTRGKVRLDSQGAKGTIVGKHAGLRFALAATVKSTVSSVREKLSSRGFDRAIRLRCGAMDTVYLASVFTPRGEAVDLDLQQEENGVEVRFGDLSVRFRSERRHLVLDGIKRA